MTHRHSEHGQSRYGADGRADRPARGTGGRTGPVPAAGTGAGAGAGTPPATRAAPVAPHPPARRRAPRGRAARLSVPALGLVLAASLLGAANPAEAA